MSSPYGGFVHLIEHDNRIVASAQRLRVVKVNLLQFTCKQLRDETRFLELRHGVKVKARAFGQLVHEKDIRLSQFQGSIDIQEIRCAGLGLTPFLARCLFDFAKANPKANITVRLSDWRFKTALRTPADFMRLGWTIETAVRGLPRKAFIGYVKAKAGWLHGSTTADINLPNIRFHTYASESDEAFFRANIEAIEPVFIKKKVLSAYKNSMEEVAAAVRKWFEEGI